MATLVEMRQSLVSPPHFTPPAKSVWSVRGGDEVETSTRDCTKREMDEKGSNHADFATKEIHVWKRLKTIFRNRTRLGHNNGPDYLWERKFFEFA